MPGASPFILMVTVLAVAIEVLMILPEISISSTRPALPFAPVIFMVNSSSTGLGKALMLKLPFVILLIPVLAVVNGTVTHADELLAPQLS